ncbi:MAG: methylthioribose-phosphate isomerase [Armatimonadetes bacterium]|jgi:methylthioribose-1-phosphate isomerase|nr:methylthioribose-phosphate isomerase [Armatimonadota bacterium]
MQAPRDTYTVNWRDGVVLMIDQRVLPGRFEVLELRDYREVADGIRTMAVRGAPAIGVSAALGLALAAQEALQAPEGEFRARLAEAADVLRGTRPTAVNLFWAIDRVMRVADAQPDPPTAAEAVLAEALVMLEEDVLANRAMGEWGAALLPQQGNILTHCNTGSLATVYHGTALGVVRSAVEQGKQLHVWVDETRPRLQGMKLTAWECAQLQIPATVITDNMAAWVMRQGKVDAVIVGADRIASNGDTANKIGTYGAAVIARAHGVPFYVAAPLSTVDFSLASGAEIPIEERATEEVTDAGPVRLAPEGVAVYNPAFDVTPAEYVTAIITERGVARAPFTESLARLRESAHRP